MARFRYYSATGFAIADYTDVEPDSVEIGENGSLVIISSFDGVKAIIHLAPGERIERIGD
jgi:hypothetical protein